MTFFVEGREPESKETKEWKEFLKEEEQRTKQIKEREFTTTDPTEKDMTHTTNRHFNDDCEEQFEEQFNDEN